MEKGWISVDRWEPGSQVYFLTHLHADHTRGLSSAWSHGPLFCSPISASLLPSRFPAFDLSLVRVLDVGVSHPISLFSNSSGSEVRILVTPIDAVHCPGAVMYLFRGEFGCVLYTGDFRWELDSDRAQLAKETLLNALGGAKVDVLYLDNTYCHPSFTFPPRVVVAKQVVDCIKEHPKHEIVIAIDTLGKEDLLLQIAQALDTKIWVWPERLKTMHLLGFDDIFTTKTCLTRVRAVPRYSFTLDTLEGLNTMHPTIGIMPSGLPWGCQALNKDDVSPSISRAKHYSSKQIAYSSTRMGRYHMYPPSFRKYAYSFPYSEHSCFNEIEEFMKIVQPTKVIGIVSASFCYINPLHYFNHISRPHHLNGKSFTDVRKALDVEDRGIRRSELGKKLRETVSSKKPTRRMAERGGKLKASSSIVQRSRACAMRKRRRGVKISVTDEVYGHESKTAHA